MTTCQLTMGDSGVAAPESGHSYWNRTRVLLYLLAAATLVFAHGCHGPDEDHELFGSRWLSAPNAARCAER